MYFGTDEIFVGSSGRNSLIFVWSSKRIGREKLNVFNLNIFIPAIKQKQLSCLNKIAKMWALLWNEMFVWEFEVGAHRSCFTTPSCYLVALGTNEQRGRRAHNCFWRV